MTDLFERLNDKAQNVAKLRLADLIMDVDLLALALCADAFEETILALKDAQYGDRCYLAAHQAIDIGFNVSMRKAMASQGFFANGLRRLLALAEQQSDTGARLMPIFYAVTSNHTYYGISKKLKREIEDYIECKRQHDGFAIMGRSKDGRVIIKAAKGLFEDWEEPED